MKHRYFLLVTAILLFNLNLAAENIEFVREPKAIKISPRFSEQRYKLAAGDSIKVWVLFTDKGIFNQAAYRQSLQGAAQNLSAKSLNRRALRKSAEEPVDFYDLPVYKPYISRLEVFGFNSARESRWLNSVSGYIDPDKLEDLASLSFVYEIRPVAVAVEEPLPDEYKDSGRRKSQFEPQDYGNSIYQYAQVNILQLHALGYSGAGVTVAVLDGGFNLDHPAFDSLNVVGQWDFVDDDPSVFDSDPSQVEHGTKVLSVLGGYYEGNIIAPAYGADFLLARTEIVGSETQIEEDDWVAAAEWADSEGADIISSSLGYYDWYTYQDCDGNTAFVTQAADLAASRGIAVFVSAGNERNKAWYYITPPADGDSVIAVGAVEASGIIAAFSSAGPTSDGRIKPDILAQGVSVYCVNPGTTGFTYMNGTSASCPIAAGAGALLLQINPSLTPMQLREALIESADNYNTPDNLYGYGIINAFEAADLLRIDEISPVNLVVGDSLHLDITITGMEDSIPAFTGVNLPLSSQLIDNGDRTATFLYEAIEEDIGSRTMLFIATSGIAADTMAVPLSISASSRIIAGPNPFSDSVSIYFGPSAGQPTEISIFAANGEKIWDNFADNSSVTSPVIWRGVNNKGEKVAAGVYLVYIRTENAEEKFKLFKK